MTIESTLPNGTPMTQDLLGGSVELVCFDIPEKLCDCDIGCCYEELALVATNDSQNCETSDTSSVLYQLQLTGDTVVIQLLKQDDSGTIVINEQNYVVQATITDNTLGTFFAKGTISGHPLKAGFLADWELIEAAEGTGKYVIRGNLTIAGQTFIKDSQVYRLMNWNVDDNPQLAHQTVKIETSQSGQITGGFDYSGMDWVQSVRVRGRLWNKQRILEQEQGETADRRLFQIQDKIGFQYTLELEYIPSVISNLILDDNLIANTVLITDFNIFANERYREKELKLADYNEGIFFKENKDGKFQITMNDVSQVPLKRNLT
ncbi:hypothetical protein LCGC14_0370610 [marine sediment metagenome]|uniref:Uncharacterized protein n=1 Tax=marine sediment metagenome TaxID=412755 RepID=A0A0F9T598_9ZZZZ|nr:hypothetical protein [Maribacter sp.]HDZ04895.1 hypothetical protein [Maribacter sp.]